MIQSKETCNWLPFELHNTAFVYQNNVQSEILSLLEGDMEPSLKIGERDTTASREAPIFDDYSNSEEEAETFLGNHLGLTMTSAP